MTDKDKLAQLRREDCRYGVRAYLAQRPTIAQTSDTICRRIVRSGEGDFEPSEIDAALNFLEGLQPPQVQAKHSPIGATLYYQITAAGVLAHERGE